VELSEKSKILENGIAVLRKEFDAVEAAAQSQKRSLSTAFKRREARKGKLTKAEGKCQDLKKHIDYQYSETTRMNRMLEQIEDVTNL
jgi:chromosome segregation ATPase